MDTLYVIIIAVAAYAVGFKNGGSYANEEAAKMSAQVRVSDYVIGYSNTVTEEDLALVNPELREAALEK
jgi:hypothetical protein